jgi:hypothetical protein
MPDFSRWDVSLLNDDHTPMDFVVVTWEEPTSRFTTSMTCWQRTHPALNTSTLCRPLSISLLYCQSADLSAHPLRMFT